MTNLINGKDWSFNYNELPGEFSFAYNNKELLLSKGVVLGILQEKFGFEDKCRLHQSDKNGTYWVETETKHPFGAEPVIKHKYEQCSNHIRVTTDIQISQPLPIDNITIDDLFIPGEWDKISSLYQVGGKLIWKEECFNKKNTLLFDELPLILLFEKNSGIQLEIGCGYDLWRWDIADKFDAKAKFVLEKSDDGIAFKRVVTEWDEEYEMGVRNFRFSWYFAWNDSSVSYERESFEHKAIVTFKNNKLLMNSEINDSTDIQLDMKSFPESMMRTSSENLCFSSKKFFNAFKRWMRAHFEKNRYEKHVLCFSELHPGVCDNSAHVSAKHNRVQKHFDYLYLIGLFEWANQLLGESELRLQFRLSEDSPLVNLPSAKGML